MSSTASRAIARHMALVHPKYDASRQLLSRDQWVPFRHSNYIAKQNAEPKIKGHNIVSVALPWCIGDKESKSTGWMSVTRKIALTAEALYKSRVMIHFCKDCHRGPSIKPCTWFPDHDALMRRKCDSKRTPGGKNNSRILTTTNLPFRGFIKLIIAEHKRRIDSNMIEDAKLLVEALKVFRLAQIGTVEQLRDQAKEGKRPGIVKILRKLQRDKDLDHMFAAMVPRC